MLVTKNGCPKCCEVFGKDSSHGRNSHCRWHCDLSELEYKPNEPQPVSFNGVTPGGGGLPYRTPDSLALNVDTSPTNIVIKRVGFWNVVLTLIEGFRHRREIIIYPGSRESCPYCNSREKEIGIGENSIVKTNVQACQGRNWFLRLFGACALQYPHTHQWCRACGGKWVCTPHDENWRMPRREHFRGIVAKKSC